MRLPAVLGWGQPYLFSSAMAFRTTYQRGRAGLCHTECSSDEGDRDVAPEVDRPLTGEAAGAEKPPADRVVAPPAVLLVGSLCRSS